MHGEKGSLLQKYTIVFQMSHLVAIPCGAPLLGKMFAEVRDMLHDFRVKAGWKSAMYNITQKEGTLDYITAHFSLFLSMSFLSLDLSSCISLLSVCFHLYPLRLCQMSSKIKKNAVSWREFRSFCLIFQKPNLHSNILKLQVRKWKLPLFEKGYMTHETTVGKIYGKTVKGYNRITVVLSLSLTQMIL